MNSLPKFVHAAYAKSPAVREIFAAAGLRPEDIRSRADLDRVPLLRKSELAGRQRSAPPFGGFLTVPEGELQRIFVSPGPIYDPEGSGPDFWRWGQALRAAGFAQGDIVLNTFSYHLTPAGMMFDNALRRLGCTVIPAGVGNAELQVQIMRETGVTGYIGVPSFLYTLVKKAQELGCRGDIRLRKAWVAAEKLLEGLRSILAQEFGIEVFQGYGTADLGCVAYECPARSGFHLAQGVIVQVVDPETGRALTPEQPGEVVVTLLEPTYPLLRFGTGDLGALTNAACPCGRPGERLTGILGRTADGVKVKGLFLYPHQVEELRSRCAGVRFLQAQISRVDFRDVLTLKIELEPDRDAAGASAAVARQAKEILRFTCGVETVPTGTFSEADRNILDTRTWE
ncbi:MAG: AMP-binding protein [Bacillota bacterium]